MTLSFEGGNNIVVMDHAAGEIRHLMTDAEEVERRL